MCSRPSLIVRLYLLAVDTEVSNLERRNDLVVWQICEDESSESGVLVRTSFYFPFRT